MYQEISLLVEKLQTVHHEPILIIGDFMLDEYLIGDTDRISPEAPVPILKVTGRQKRPAARALSRQVCLLWALKPGVPAVWETMPTENLFLTCLPIWTRKHPLWLLMTKFRLL